MKTKIVKTKVTRGRNKDGLIFWQHYNVIRDGRKIASFRTAIRYWNKIIIIPTE